MFTIDDLKKAHSKVKSGADFPAYIKELKQMGVTRYETFVSDGRVNFQGANGYVASAMPKYPALEVAGTTNLSKFKTDLKSHQQGETDYKKFMDDCASSGVERWVVDLQAMTCTYYDRNSREVLVERIPG